MVLPIHIEDKNIVLEKDLIEKVKTIGKRIEQQLRKCKSYLIIARSWKWSSPWRMYKQRKLIKYGIFKVLRKIDEKNNKLELQDNLDLHYKFHPLDYTQTREQVSFEKGRMI